VPRQVTLPFRPPPPLSKSAEAFERLARERALHSLIRWALPLPLLRGLLKDAIPRRMEAEIPPEAWGSMAAALAMADPIFGGVVAQALHDRLGWDREPADIQELDRLTPRPLRALLRPGISSKPPSTFRPAPRVSWTASRRRRRKRSGTARQSGSASRICARS
jgi:hypothetical protein